MAKVTMIRSDRRHLQRRLAMATVLLVLCCLSLLGFAQAQPAGNSSGSSASATTAPCAFINGTDGNSTENRFLDPFALDILAQTDVTKAYNFTVQYGNNYKVVRNNGAKEIYILHQCGVAMQNVVLDNPQNYTIKHFIVPLTTIAVDGTTAVRFLELLGVVDRIALAGPDIISPCIQQLLAGGQIVLLNTTSAEPALAQMEAKQVPALISTGAIYLSRQEVSNQSKFISFTENTAEFSPLKRAEWIKFLSLFFNLERRATAVYNQIEESYNCSAKSVQAVTSKPVVAWVSFYADNATFSASEYLREFVADAGGLSAVTSKTVFNTSIPSEAAAFHSLLQTVNILIDDTWDQYMPYTFSNFTAIYNLTAAEGARYPFLATGNVWRSDRRVNSGYSTDWFESAVAEPNVILNELIGIIHPEKGAVEHKFFRNITNGELEVVLTAANCTAGTSSPSNPTIPICQTLSPAVPSTNLIAAAMNGTSKGDAVVPRASVTVMALTWIVIAIAMMAAL